MEKFALAKACASCSPAVKGDRFIVSEVNWPLLDTGVYSPVCSPYLIPGSHTNDPSVDEETYADYMIRYYALALCSGHVDAVYWWRLAAHGFGLVDDIGEVWRPRPAVLALKTFIDVVGQSIFKEKIETPDGVYALRFAGRDGGSVILAWAHPQAVDYDPPFAWNTVIDRDGRELQSGGGSVRLSGSPMYFIDVR